MGLSVAAEPQKRSSPVFLVVDQVGLEVGSRRRVVQCSLVLLARIDELPQGHPSWLRSLEVVEVCMHRHVPVELLGEGLVRTLDQEPLVLVFAHLTVGRLHLVVQLIGVGLERACSLDDLAPRNFCDDLPLLHRVQE